MLKDEIKKKNLVEILGLEDLPIEGQVEIIDKSVDVIEKRCLNTILDSLDEKGKKQFATVLDKKEPGEVAEFFKEKNINMKEILEKEVVRFKKEAAERFQR